MLTQLSITNYAIVDTLDIEFESGLSAITGETGAGKSIILGALGLALGDRGDRDAVREGTRRADISARFDTTRLPRARQWLEDQELAPADDSGECMLRRTISTDGRSRAWVNAVPVNLQTLRVIGEMLIDIHSQHEHQSLLERATHQRLLDDFAGQQALAGELRRLHREWKANRQALQELRQQEEERAAQHELLRYQVEELDELAPAEGELGELETEFRRLDSAETALSSANSLLQLCSEDDEHNISASIHQALSLLEHIDRSHEFVEPVAEMLNSAAIQVDEAAAELRRGIDHFEIDPERLEAVNQRIADLQGMARKHRVSPEELPARHAELRERLAGADDEAHAAERLEAEDRRLRGEYEEQAGQLSAHRHRAAGELADAVNARLAELGMADARLEVSLEAVDDSQPHPGGLESIEFRVSTNPGQPPRPLHKIASGGELSRISLAIQVITALTSETPSLVFDEVDVGIGGDVARAVGEMLRQLGDQSQVLCVTHQALVASRAHHHLFVSKENPDSESTQTRIRPLQADEKVREVARMLGGETGEQGFSEQSLAHAQELVESG